MGAEVAGRGRAGPVAADQATRQHAIGSDRDPKLPAHRQDRVLDAPRDRRIFDLQVDDRLDGGGAADRVGAHFRQADMADIAGLHQVSDRANRVLDRHGRVEPGGAVGLAALLAGHIDISGKNVVIVLSGGNVDADLYARLIG
ncbi:threonine dehydratase [mine drainage metagenome]|uniref:Threonine dehydratase n=1 Tax=mine drainage metagenome TaxID=410659 RepID=A0A1J5PVN7_9ZZZZ